MLEATNYKLMNVTGTVLQQGSLESGQDEVLTKDLAPGMYLLELSNRQQHGVVRVMKR